MSNRAKMTIIVIPSIRMFHFTDMRLAGLRNDAWYSYQEEQLFQYVEKNLVHAGIAHNVTLLEETVRNGNSIDYVVTYNKAKPIEVMNKACFVSEVKVGDPDTNGQVDIAIYKDSESGGMFGVDSSYLMTLSDDDPVNNPFNCHLIELV